MATGFKKVKEQIEYNLRIPQYFKRTWIIIFWVTLALLALSSVGIIAIKVPTNFNTDANLVINIKSNGTWALAACIMDYIAFGFIALPYFFLAACWIVGIDNITKSKHFHIFIWIVYLLAATIALVGLIIAFRAYIVI